jgi:hypothetical protein
MLPRELNAGSRERGFCLNGTRLFKEIPGGNSSPTESSPPARARTKSFIVAREYGKP